MPSYKHTGNIIINMLFNRNNPISSFFYEKDVQKYMGEKHMHNYTLNAHSKLFLNIKNCLL